MGIKLINKDSGNIDLTAPTRTSIALDTTLTIEGQAADSKAVGDAINALYEGITETEKELQDQIADNKGSIEDLYNKIPAVEDGKDGENGGYYIPTVSNGVLSWAATKEDMPAVQDANIKGDKGEKGEKGETGAQGLKGDKGDKGDTGASGKDGVSVSHSWSGTVLTVTSSSGTSSADLKGAKGDTGEKGDKGDTGETGAQGVQGLKGDTGAQGEKGDTGKTAFQYAQDGGYTGTEEEFSSKLAGDYATAVHTHEADKINCDASILYIGGKTLDKTLTNISTLIGDTRLEVKTMQTDIGTKANKSHFHAANDITYDLPLSTLLESGSLEDVIYDIDENITSFNSSLSNKANKSDIPTKVSQLEDAYLYCEKEHTHKATEIENDSPTEYVSAGTLDEALISIDEYIVELKEDVNKKANITAIPTKTSQLTNDSGYLTAHQDISGKADKASAETWTFTLADGSTVSKKVVLA